MPSYLWEQGPRRFAWPCRDGELLSFYFGTHSERLDSGSRKGTTRSNLVWREKNSTVCKSFVICVCRPSRCAAQMQLASCCPDAALITRDGSDIEFEQGYYEACLHAVNRRISAVFSANPTRLPLTTIRNRVESRRQHRNNDRSSGRQSDVHGRAGQEGDFLR